VVSLPQAVHTVITAPTGLGKNVSCIVPFLRTSAESCVIIDFKGENANQTAEFRRRVFGNRVVVLDPYGVTSLKSDTFNPLDFISEESPLAIDDCNDLANALVVRPEEEKEPHWNDSAEVYISAVAAMVVAYGERNHGTRSLHTVREILAHPQKLEMAVKAMTESEHWGGLLAQMGGALMHFVDKEKSSVLTTALRHLRFLGTPAIVNNTRSSSFDPAELRDGRMTIFLVLPPDRAHAQAGLLRMWIGSLLRACVRGGLQ
jgi:type IV secretion system protein VirD4